MSDHTISFYRSRDELRIRIDSPGTAAQSAPVGDPMAFLTVAANQCGLEVDDSVAGQITVSVPAGG